jgi:hypothetical protein
MQILNVGGGANPGRLATVAAGPWLQCLLVTSSHSAFCREPKAAQSQTGDVEEAEQRRLTARNYAANHKET